MTKVAILPIATEQGALAYRAVAGEKHAQGKTAGEALDALTAQIMYHPQSGWFDEGPQRGPIHQGDERASRPSAHA